MVVAAGPWVAELLPAMRTRIRLTRQQMAFFVPADPAPFRRGRFPVWSILSPGNLWYGFPYLHEGWVKVAEDSKVDDTRADVSREPTAAFLDWAREFVARHIPALSRGELAGGRSCLYTNMADMEDEQFVIDWAPGRERVLIGRVRLRPWLQVRRLHRAGDRRRAGGPGESLGDLFRIGTRFN